MVDPIVVSAPVEGTDTTLSFETGKLAFQSQGAVMARLGKTDRRAQRKDSDTIGRDSAARGNRGRPPPETVCGVIHTAATGRDEQPITRCTCRSWWIEIPNFESICPTWIRSCPPARMCGLIRKNTGTFPPYVAPNCSSIEIESMLMCTP